MADCTNLKVGDDVILWAGGLSSRYPSINAVEKVYKKHVVVAGQKFQRWSGYRAGGDIWHRGHIEPITDESLAVLEEP